MKYVTASLASIIVIASVAQASAGGFGGTTNRSLISTGSIVVAPSVDLGKIGLLNGNRTGILNNVLSPVLNGVLSDNDCNSLGLGILSGNDGRKARRH